MTVAARTLTFVTGNDAKVRELQAGLGADWVVHQDRRGYTEIQADTLREVCDAGADELLAAGLAPPFVLEDSGLFIEGLRGFPGVYSRHALDTLGVQGVLRAAADLVDRRSVFRTDLLLVVADSSRHHFVGECRGRLAAGPSGAGGFGFDPIFIPQGETRTFAQMETAEKGAVSHRGQAVRGLLERLQKQTAKA